ncbi:MAG: hydantoinase B/oxoprolinase family protein [Lautropia sp.]
MDPVAFTLLRNSLELITDEMTLTMVRTAYSGNIRDAMDFSAAICSGSGDMIAQGPCLAVHLGSIPAAMAAVRERFAGEMASGDVYMINDPYCGGMHLPDIFLFKPLYGDSGLLAFLVIVADHVDVGGHSAGSRSVLSQEIFAEGLRIPPVRLQQRGEDCTDVWNILRQNTRLPQMVLGDIRSCLAAFHSAEQMFRETVAEHGEAATVQFFSDALAYSEQFLRQWIRSIPNGSYRFTDWLDDGVATPEPVRIEVGLEVRDDSLHFDFTGSSPQVKASINATRSFTESSVYAAVRTLLPNQVPNNAGLFRPIRVHTPAGSVVHASEPAAVAQRGVTGSRVIDAVLGVLAKVAPERVPAASEGGISSVRITGRTADGRSFVVWDSIAGTWGGRPDRDGIDGCSSFAMNVANVSAEMIEAEYPVMIHRYALRADSGGAGRYRGGLGICREWELLDGEATFVMRSDRARSAPWGLAGGGQGARSRSVFDPEGEARLLPSKFELPIKRGDRILHEQAAGGGHGDPFSRDPQRVLRDWENGKITDAHARDAYGVVIREAAIDAAATRARRAAGRMPPREPDPDVIATISR